MLMLAAIGLLVLVGIVGVGAYWIANNVTFKKDGRNE
jgi:ABC-type phosphate transport system auxiliary subunit